MGRTISLFSGYSQKENRTTNYCLLVLKMIYEENPKFLAEILSGLVGYDMSEFVGVRFRQQERKPGTVPDGLISQRSFTVYIETKNFDWFYNQQLENHLEALSGETQGLKVLLALGNFDGDISQRFDLIKRLCKKKYRGQIFFSAVSFEDYINVIEDLLVLPKNVSDIVRDLRVYLDEEGLLPSWRNSLDVVNCAGLPEDVLEGHVYMCPAQAGAYSHARCKYFGMYRQKRVEQIAIIRAVVDVESQDQATLLWANTDDKTSLLLSEAKNRVQQLRPGEFPTRVFLLDELFETTFSKDSPGGMLGSKQYFDISRFGAENAEQLSDYLRGKSWSELR